MKHRILALAGCLALAAFLPAPARSAEDVHLNVDSGHHDFTVVVKFGGTCGNDEVHMRTHMTAYAPCAWYKGTGSVVVSNGSTKAKLCEMSFDRDDRYTFRAENHACTAEVNGKGRFHIRVVI